MSTTTPLQLTGRLDSPFVRRVAITLHEYALPFELDGLSTFQQFDKTLDANPLGTIPSMRLEGGIALRDSSFIIDHLDGLVGSDRSLTPQAGSPARPEVQAVVAVALGLAEKSVELRTETIRRPPEMIVRERVQRITKQIHSALDWLEARATRSDWLAGDRFTQADLTTAVACTNLRTKNPEFLRERAPALLAHATRCESRVSFRSAPVPAVS